MLDGLKTDAPAVTPLAEHVSVPTLSMVAPVTNASRSSVTEMLDTVPPPVASNPMVSGIVLPATTLAAPKLLVTTKPDASSGIAADAADPITDTLPTVALRFDVAVVAASPAGRLLPAV